MADEEWNFTSFEKFINQRFADFSLQFSIAMAAAEKAIDKAETAQQLRNESQNEFRKSLSDLSGLMWTTKEGSAAIDSMRREFGAATENLDKKISALSAVRIEATEAIRRTLDARISQLENSYANMQGRMWGISAIWAIIVLAVSIVVRFIK